MCITDKIWTRLCWDCHTYDRRTGVCMVCCSLDPKYPEGYDIEEEEE